MTKAEVEQQKKEAEARVNAMLQIVNDFHCHLLSPKFHGPGNDYIQTQDVFNWLDMIRQRSD